MTEKQKYQNEKALVNYFKNRYPDGKKDKGSRWYPDESERCSCCASIRSPSRSFPWSLWHHCKSIKHLKNLLHENPSTLDKDVKIALVMTQHNAPEYINSESKLLQYMVAEIYGHHRDSREITE